MIESLEGNEGGTSQMKKVFTLAEALIVIVIIAILAGVAIPNIKRIRTTNNDISVHRRYY